MLYGWADLYSSQLHSGEGYHQLRPTYAIWLLGEDVLPESKDYAHDFRLRDRHGRGLLDHGGIWLLELDKFQAEQVDSEQDRWLKFFKDGETLDSDTLPSWMQTPEMRQAMSTLKTFSEKERAYHAYQARQNYLREQRSIQHHLDELRAEAEQARASAEQARASAEQARATAEQAQAALEQERTTKKQQQMALDQERTAKEQERAAKEAALAEIERLKAQLRHQAE